jgi:hypothetical protein
MKEIATCWICGKRVLVAAVPRTFTCDSCGKRLGISTGKNKQCTCRIDAVEPSYDCPIHRGA